MRALIWGCIEEWQTGKEDNPYDFGKAGIGVECVQVFGGERILQLTITKNTGQEQNLPSWRRGLGPVSPIWLTFERIEEAEELILHLSQGVERLRKNQDYHGGNTPTTFCV